MSSIPNRLSELRRALDRATDLTGGVDLQRELGRVADEALDLGARLEQEEGCPPAELDEMAFELQARAEADISGMTLKPALDFWLRMGPTGWALALATCNKNILPFTKLEAYLNGLPGRHKLLLLHLAARVRRDQDPAFAAWTAQRLADTAAYPPDVAQAYLKAVARAGQKAPMALARALRALPEAAPSATLSALLDGCARATATPPAAADEPAGQAPDTHLACIEAVLELALANPANRGDIPLCRAVSRLLTHGSSPVRVAALSALTDLVAPNIEKFCAFLFRKHPDDMDTAAPVAARLDARQLTALSKALPPPLRARLLARIFVLLQHAAPDFLSALLREIGPQWGKKATQNAPVAAKALALAKQITPVRALFKEPATGPAPAYRPAPPSKKPQAKKTRELFARAIEAPFTVEDLAIPFGAAEGHEIKRLTFKRCDFTGARLKKLRFEGATFLDTRLSGAVLAGCVFEGCKFERCDFSGSALQETAFVQCAFKACSFAGAFFTECELRDGALSKTHFPHAAFRETFLDVLDVSEANLHGASFENCELRAVRLSAAALNEAVFLGTRLGGLELADAVLMGARFERVEGDNVVLHGGGLGNCRFLNVSFDNGALLAEVLVARRARFAEAARGLAGRAAPAWLGGEAGEELTRRVAGRWCTRRQIFAQAQTLFANNDRRLSMTLSTLGPAKSEFFLLLPQLLQCDAFEREKTKGATFPLCRVAHYEPGYALREMGLRHFKGFDLDEPPEDAPVVEAVYTIGSVGSIAMTEASDLDYWVCLDPMDATAETIAALQDKLARLSLWAAEAFDLEITFFVMSMEAVRRNDFGFSDKESSGSAQALLLKEEFYRTALKVAGGNLAWWMVPPGVSEAEYSTYLKLFRKPYSGVAGRVTDMGCMRPIPPGEFFGASLWQLVKAFKSPFKSMMKFGLLDKYVRGGESGAALLCDRIKVNLTSAPGTLLGIDPYAVLFKEVRDFYAASGEKDAVALMDLAFVEKLGAGGQQAEQLREHELTKTRVLRECFAQGGSAALDKARRRHTFEDMLRLGASVNAFMLGTYDKVQRSLAARKIEVRIDPTDTTRMGRKLFAAFARRDNKIQRIPFVNPVKGGFQAIHFSAEKAPGKQPVWVVRGLPPRLASRLENYEEIRRGVNLPAILAWIVANKVYSAKAMIDVDRSMSPVSAQDLHNIMPALYEFFPPGPTFEVDLDETLRPERITRAFFVLNILSDRGANVIREVAAMYATNWGELFCVHTGVKGDTIRANPKAFLKQLTGQELDPHLKTAHFVPHDSKCPRLLA
jgi:adenylate cyclase class 1